MGVERFFVAEASSDLVGLADLVEVVTWLNAVVVVFSSADLARLGFDIHSPT